MGEIRATDRTLIEGAAFLASRAANGVPDDAIANDLYLASDALKHVLDHTNPRYVEAGQILLRQEQERQARRAARREEAKDG